MKKLLIFLIVLSLFPLVSASDQQLPQTCGGDNELLISCLGDQELIFLGGIAPSSIGGLHVGIGPESTETPKKEIVIPIEKEETPLIMYLIPIILLLSFVFFVYKKGKEKEKEKAENKNLNSSTT